MMGSTSHHFSYAQTTDRRLLVNVDGRVKLVLLLAALLLNLTAGGLRVPLLLFILALLLTRMSGGRLRPFLQRMAVPFMLAVTAFITQLFWVKEGAELVSFTLLNWDIVFYQEGLVRGLELAARLIGGMGVLLFFSLNTPLPEMMRAAAFFRCPPVLVELALIMYRYIFLLLEEAGRIRSAQRARLGFVNSRNVLRSAGILGGMLVLRTFDRAERSFEAMRCRGYRGVLTKVSHKPMLTQDWGVLLGGLLVLLVLFFLG